ncbi:MAG: TolC family protein [Bacteroidales bacterium]|nr:TolC family protein [Bacteroidales bacterium]
MRKYFLIICSLVLITSLKAQEVWTLEKCVEYALTNNIQVKQQLLQVENEQALLQQDKLSLLPSVNGGASHGYNFGQTVDRYTNQFATNRVQTDNFYLGSTVTLFGGLQKLNQIKQRKKDLEATHFDTDKFMDDMSLNIATGYLQILYYKELVKTTQNQLNATELQSKRLKILVDAGSLAQGDFYTLEAQRALDNSQVVSALNNLDIAYLTLVQMLDLPTTQGFEIETPDLEMALQPSLATSAEQIYGFALETQPVIKSAESRVKSSEIGLSMAQGGQSPTLTLQGSLGTGFSGANKILDTINYSYNTKPFADQVKDNFNRSISLNLNVPIFNGWATRTAISRAKINVENSQYNLELSKLQLRKTIEQAYADAKAALNNYNASTIGVNAARESFRYADQKFNVGTLNSVDYNNSKKDLAKAESDQLNAKFEFIFKSTVLDFYMGKPLSLKRK